MRVFVTGASGFIGSAIVQELLGAGHQVVGLARSDASAKSIAAAGAEVQRGALDDLESLQRATAAADGVIHTAFNHDFINVSREVAAKADLLAIGAFGTALAGSNRPFIVTSGTAALTAGQVGTEEQDGDPRSPAAARIPAEHATLALAAKGVRASVLRLPPSVHGDGDHGFVPALIGIARASGVSAYIGEGKNRWPAVHRLDAALLYRLALEKGAAGSRYHCIGDSGVLTREIAEVIGKRLNLPVLGKSGDAAAAHFTWLGHFFALDVPCSSALTEARLGWRPTRPGLLEDLERGRYFDAT